MSNQGYKNTDRELWSASPDAFASSIHVTERGGIGVNVGGTVIVMPIEKWHTLAVDAWRKRPKDRVWIDEAGVVPDDVWERVAAPQEPAAPPESALQRLRDFLEAECPGEAQWRVLRPLLDEIEQLIERPGP